MNRVSAFVLTAISMIPALLAAEPCGEVRDGMYFRIADNHFVVTCWPVLANETTSWKDLAGTPITQDMIEQNDHVIATGCFDLDGFTLLADEVVLQETVTVAGLPGCADSYTGQFLSFGSDPTRIFLTCWPVRVNDSTVWKDLDGNPVNREDLTFEDVCTATGCFDVDGFTLLADEVVLQEHGSGNIATSDEQVVLGIGAGPSWFLQTVSDSSIGATGAGNPNAVITLEVGKRYTFTNAAPVAHPFALVALGKDPAGDTVVLAQGAGVGSLEADVDINWQENANDVSFTVTPGLVTALDGDASQQPGYRCEVHTLHMRGTLSFITPSAVGDWLRYN